MPVADAVNVSMKSLLLGQPSDRTVVPRMSSTFTLLSPHEPNVPPDSVMLARCPCERSKRTKPILLAIGIETVCGTPIDVRAVVTTSAAVYGDGAT